MNLNWIWIKFNSAKSSTEHYSYLICKKLGITKDHKSFRLDLIHDLIKDSVNDDNSFKRVTRSGKDRQANSIDVNENRFKKIWVSSSFELPVCRLVGNNHYVEYRNNRETCLWCQYQQKKIEGSTLQNSPQSNYWCSEYNVSLYCNKSHWTCFKEFHTFVENWFFCYILNLKIVLMNLKNNNNKKYVILMDLQTSLKV